MAQEKLRNVRTEKETLMGRTKRCYQKTFFFSILRIFYQFNNTTFPQRQQKKSSSTSEELSGLKAKLRLAEEKIQRLAAENDSLKEELKVSAAC